MSPFSFLSSFAFPTFPSISVPDIGSYLPENIQKRLVSYLLQRTLGKFVKKDGLQLERIEAEINQGRIRLEGLQIDVESVNALLSPDSAYRIREGHLDVIDICLPFPNVWSGPLSLNISSIQVILETIPESPLPSTRTSGNDVRQWDLNESLQVASDDFVRTVLNKDEENQLQNSAHGFRQTTTQEAMAADFDPFALEDDNASEMDDDPFSAPGGFPKHTASGHNAGKQGGSTAAMIESLIETLLARLQVAVNQVVVQYHHEGPSSKYDGSANIDIDLRLDGIRYALNQTIPTAEPKKTLTIKDLSIWLVNQEVMDEKVKEALVTPLSEGKKEEIDMMMSLGIADLRESRYAHELVTGLRNQMHEQHEDDDVGPASSLYESAIDETREHSPFDTPPRHDPSLSAAKSVPFPRETTKIFGIQQEGIVIQMWKETSPLDGRSGKDSPPSDTTSRGRISVELGRLALKLDTEHLQALIAVFGSLARRSQREQTPQADSRPAQEGDRSTDNEIRVALASLDVHYLYNHSNQQFPRPEPFWETLDTEVIQEDHLHLQILPLTVDITEADGIAVGLRGVALYNIHQRRASAPTVLAQPLLICGSAKLPRYTWLPSTRDVVETRSAESPESHAQAQGRIRMTKTGRSIQLGHVQVFFDPAVVNRLSQPLRQMLTVYAMSKPTTAQSTEQGDGSSAAGYFRVNVDSITLKMYCPSDVDDCLRPQSRPEGKLTCHFEAMSFDQSPHGAIQASLEYITAVYENELVGDALTWLTSGTPSSQGWSQRALDLSYLPSRSKRVSLVISIIAFDLNQRASHGLQYFADGYATWFDASTQGGNDTGTLNSRPEGVQMVQSDDSTAGSNSSSSSVVGEDEIHIECVVLKATVCIKSGARDIAFEATDIDATVHGITGPKKGNRIDCTIFALEMSETDHDAASPRTILRSDMRDNDRAGFDARPVIILCFTSTQEQETRYKDSVISLSLSNTFFNMTPGIPWVEVLCSVTSSPAGVFENVVPSDSTKVTVVVQDCTAFLPAVKRQGAISVDIDIAVSLSDDFIPTNARKRGTNDTLPVDFDFALSFLLKESRLLIVSGPRARTKIDISYASMDIPLCADTKETFQEVVQDISDAWNVASKDSPTSSSSEAPTPPDVGVVPDVKSLLSSLSDLAPSLAASSFEEDLLRDDLPSNADFVRGNLSTLNRPKAPEPDRLAYEDKGTIRILYNESFELYQDYLTKLEETVCQNNDPGGSSLVVNGTAINIRILLHGGYDWQTTRSAVASETDALRQRLRKLGKLISSGNPPPQELRRTHVELFNSIHIGIADDSDYQDPDQLLAAINDELADLDSETASSTTYKTQPTGRMDGGSGRHSKGRQKKLSRSRRPQMEISLRDAAFRYAIEDPTADVVGSFKLSLQKAEIIDHIKTSTWKTFLTAMKKISTRDILETEAKMLRILVDWVKPGIGQMPEARVNIEVAPLRFHIDQDALDFMKRFFSFTRKPTQAASPMPESPTLNNKGFIQHVEIQPILVKMDYKPKRLNLKALQQGSAMEVINLFHFESATMTLRHVSINGVPSWGELYSQLLAIWTPDVKSNQMSDLLTGIAPVRSMVKAGTGVADLILLPLEQYRKDGKIVKGMRRGATSFASNTLSEVATVGAQLATGTQVILERAERALGGRQPEYSDLPDMMESINLTDYDAGRAAKTSRYADQPANVNQGIAAAYSSLASNLTSAAQTILAVPMEVLDEAGGQTSTTRAVIRAVPIAVLQGMIGVTDASRKTLFGVKNQLDPKNQGDKESKYKRR